MTFLNFLIQVNIYLTLFYLFYALLLKNETFFTLNRVYLISTALLSLLIPTLQLDCVQALLATQKAGEMAYTITLTALPLVHNNNSAPDQLALIDYLTYLYLGGVTLFSIRFLVNLFSTIYQNSDSIQAHSFFKKIRVSQILESRNVIVKHELVHARQYHSADIIFFELLAIVNWFNPVLLQYKNAIRSIHEYIADEITSKTEDKAAYATLLLSQALGAHKLTNSFFNRSLLKQRILMLHKPKSSKVAILKYGFTLPLFAGMLIFSSAALKAGTLNHLEYTIEKLDEVAEANHDNALGGIKTDESALEVIKTKIKESKDRAVENDTQNISKKNGKTGQMSDDTIYQVSKVEIEPEFPGGIGKFYEFIGKNYKYSNAAKEQGIAGRLIVTFVVETDGSLTDIRVLRDLGLGTGEEAVRVLNTSPKWRPAQQGGKAVKVSYTLPIMLNVPKQESSGSTTLKADTIVIKPNQESGKNHFILNGKQISYEEFKKLDQKAIESITVIKDDKEKLKELGAPEDASGVIIIKLK